MVWTKFCRVRTALEDYDKIEKANIKDQRRDHFSISAHLYLHVSVAQFQTVSLVKLGGVFQDFHGGQQVTAVLRPVVR